jgi:hypothetical protein
LKKLNEPLRGCEHNLSYQIIEGIQSQNPASLQRLTRRLRMNCKVECSICGKVRDIIRIGKDNTKEFYCSSCGKMVKTKLKKKSWDK